MRGTLGIWKKVNLYLNAWHDVQTDQFHFAEHELEDGTKDRYAVSQFIMTELSRYGKIRTDYRNWKIVFFWTPTAKYLLWVFRFRNLDGAIADIDSAVERTQADILAEYAEYNRQKEELRQAIEKYYEEEATHYAAMMEKRAQMLARKFIKRERRRYKAAISVLKRKKNLLMKSQNALARRRQRLFLAIATYYQYASRWHDRLPVQYMGDDRFAAIADISTLAPYEDVLEDAEEKLAIYSDELGKLVV